MFKPSSLASARWKLATENSEVENQRLDYRTTARAIECRIQSEGNLRRWLPVAGALIGAAVLGVVAGLSVAGDMPKLPPLPMSIQPDGPEPPADAFARDAGYSMAKALGKRTMVSCETLKPVFRAGCRDYIRDSFRRPERDTND